MEGGFTVDDNDRQVVFHSRRCIRLELEMECPICLGPLNRCPDGIEDGVRRRLARIRTATCCCTPCGHLFHKACLLTWLDQSNRPPCPVCNVKLSKMKLYPAYLNIDKEKEGLNASTKRGENGMKVQPTLTDTSGMPLSVGASATATSSTDVAPGRYPPACSTIVSQEPIAQTNEDASMILSPQPGGNGLAPTMTIGAYAVTTVGPFPLVPPAALGALPGTTVPRAHPHPREPGQAGPSVLTNLPAQYASLSPPVPLPCSSTSSSARGSTWSGGVDYRNLPLRETGLHAPRDSGSGNEWYWSFPTDSTAELRCTNIHHRLLSSGRLSRSLPYYRQPPQQTIASTSSSTASFPPQRATNILSGRHPTGGTSTASASTSANNANLAGREFSELPEVHCMYHHPWKMTPSKK